MTLPAPRGGVFTRVFNRSFVLGKLLDIRIATRAQAGDWRSRGQYRERLSASDGAAWGQLSGAQENGDMLTEVPGQTNVQDRVTTLLHTYVGLAATQK